MHIATYNLIIRALIVIEMLCASSLCHFMALNFQIGSGSTNFGSAKLESEAKKWVHHAFGTSEPQLF